MVAVLGAATASGAAAANAAGLPDGRAYELVSPVDKNSQDVVVNTGGLHPFAGFSADGGDAVVYKTWGALPGSESAGVNTYRALRSSTGWSTDAIQHPHAAKSGPDAGAFQWFSGDLSTGAFLAGDPPLVDGAPEKFNNLYLETFGGPIELLTPVAPLNAMPSTYYLFNGYTMVGRSIDGQHVVFQSTDALTSDAPSYATSVYDFSGGQLHLVGVRPDGTPDLSGSVGGAGGAFWMDFDGTARSLAHAVSDDGSAIFWTSISDGQLYVRRQLSTTDPVSASQASVLDPNGLKPASFICAAADGSSVLFSSASELTDDANTGEDGVGNPTDAGRDLYRYDVASGALTDLTVSSESADSATGAAVQGAVGCSDDARVIYFVALGKLAPGATSGSPNLYIDRDGSISLVATLESADAANWAETVFGKTAAASADGGHLAFTSQASVTSYDNTDPNGTPQDEVYLYDAGTKSLECASCRAFGRPEGPSRLALESPFRVRRGLADGGRRVFFSSSDAIVTTDVNGRQDVYEFTEGDAPRLLSGGDGGGDTAFVDASASGDDVFMVTRNRLVGRDQDDVADIYDARVGGGFEEATPSTPCSSGECHAVSLPPQSPNLLTQTFFGSGNAALGPRSYFYVHPISDWAREHLAKTGQIKLVTDVSGPGKLKATISARMPGVATPVAHQSTQAGGGGPVRMNLHLSRRARRWLAGHHVLHARLTVRFSPVNDAQDATIDLHR